MYFKFNREEGTKMASLSSKVNWYALEVVEALTSEVFNEGRERPFKGCVVLLVSAGGESREHLKEASHLLCQLFVADGRSWSFADFSLWSRSVQERVAFLAENPGRFSSLGVYTHTGGIFFTLRGEPMALAVASYCPDLDEAAAIALAVLGVMLDLDDLGHILAESQNRWVVPLLKELLVRYPDHQYLKKVLKKLETQASS